MKVVIEVSQAEMDIISALESWGWVRPHDIEVELKVDTVSSPAPPLQPKPVTMDGAANVGAAGEVVRVPIAKTPPGGFETIFNWIIPQEGTYTDDPNDPGGPTMYGIDTKDDKAEWTAMGVTDIRNLTLDQAKAIYQKKYWIGALCDTMPTPVAEVHFNYAVNVGAEQSVKFMQSALAVNVDGQFGPITQGALAAEKAVGLLKGIALGMIAAADSFYHGLAEQGRFKGDLQGWLNRNNSLRTLINSWT